MSDNLEVLRKVAEAATPGPWVLDGLDQVVRTPDRGIVHDDSCADSEEWLANTDAPFIATFDPPAVLALITRLEQAEQAVQRVREVCEGQLCGHCADEERDTAEAQAQAKLEAEALELCNTYRIGADIEPINSWDEAHPLAQDEWVPVARRARELNKETPNA